jgi:hypothetical protein
MNIYKCEWYYNNDQTKFYSDTTTCELNLQSNKWTWIDENI